MEDVSVVIRRAKRSNEPRLDLRNRGLESIPDEVFKLGNLRELLLSNNKLRVLDGRIGYLTNLNMLDLSSNSLSTLPPELANILELKELTVEGNPLKPPFSKLIKLPPRDARSALDSCFGICREDAAGSVTYEDDFEDVDQSPSFPPRENTPMGFPARKSSPALSSSSPASFLSEPANWQVERARMKNEITELRAKLKQMEDTGMKKSVPPPAKDWLTSTLPPTRTTAADMTGGLLSKTDEDPLQAEQRNVRRLRAEVQRLNARLADAEMAGGAVGNNSSGVEVDFSEVETGDRISQGGFSVVHKGVWRGTTVAIKKIFDPVVTDELISELQNEITMLSRLRHPHIILLMGVCTKPPNLAIITEFIGLGSLFDVLHKSDMDLDLAVKLRLSSEIASSIAFLHSSGIVHRDLKSHNVLLDESVRVKLCDFGLARFKSQLGQGSMQFAGTPCYMCPEVFRRHPYNEKVDVWAFGVLLWEIFSRQVPHDGLDPAEVREKVLAGEPLPNPLGCPREISRLIRDCCNVEPLQRPSMNQALIVLRGLLPSR
eukprot:GILJ01002577.1.p1 GENE.GILJ01002577.1~~GILJ01002577.1.p1  ORF type:complete len:545 (-),score=81.60 GILJ01002577.1:98-1732(-)